MNDPGNCWSFQLVTFLLYLRGINVISLLLLDPLSIVDWPTTPTSFLFCRMVAPGSDSSCFGFNLDLLLLDTESLPWVLFTRINLSLTEPIPWRRLVDMLDCCMARGCRFWLSREFYFVIFTSGNWFESKLKSSLLREEELMDFLISLVSLADWRCFS